MELINLCNIRYEQVYIKDILDGTDGKPIKKVRMPNLVWGGGTTLKRDSQSIPHPTHTTLFMLQMNHESKHCEE